MYSTAWGMGTWGSNHFELNQAFEQVGFYRASVASPPCPSCLLRGAWIPSHMLLPETPILDPPVLCANLVALSRVCLFATTSCNGDNLQGPDSVVSALQSRRAQGGVFYATTPVGDSAYVWGGFAHVDSTFLLNRCIILFLRLRWLAGCMPLFV